MLRPGLQWLPGNGFQETVAMVAAGVGVALLNHQGLCLVSEGVVPTVSLFQDLRLKSI